MRLPHLVALLALAACDGPATPPVPAARVMPATELMQLSEEARYDDETRIRFRSGAEVIRRRLEP